MSYVYGCINIRTTALQHKETHYRITGRLMKGERNAGLPAHVRREAWGQGGAEGAWMCLVSELCNAPEFARKVCGWLSLASVSSPTVPDFAYRSASSESLDIQLEHTPYTYTFLIHLSHTGLRCARVSCGSSLHVQYRVVVACTWSMVSGVACPAAPQSLAPCPGQMIAHLTVCQGRAHLSSRALCLLRLALRGPAGIGSVGD